MCCWRKLPPVVLVGVREPTAQCGPSASTETRQRCSQTPKEFSGWLLSIGPSSGHGYSDIVLGWHMGSVEASLSYFRFDSNSYHTSGTAKLQTDDEQNQKNVPLRIDSVAHTFVSIAL